ncbi:putative monooxygenase YcnE [Methanobrevibacter cuticularis]|uniref:Putative monooxygenase YcnE n=1 Tax=Methanobrevibacter cuticularis TaxID=47311 RepID=A0A166DL05_9EURY|nr:putative quinol monooxygenase [Methanobrevibacter cuticularis]KZX15706.1 putative monooxygenase YcnE [Methanobrevibacter cuticularis]
MILVLAKIAVKKGKSNELLDISKALIRKSRIEDGCISYNLYSDVENEDLFVMVEYWQDEKALNEHFETIHFKNFGVEISDVLAKDIDLDKYDLGELL